MTETSPPQPEPYADVLARFRSFFPNIRVLDFPEDQDNRNLSVKFSDKAPYLPRQSKPEPVFLGVKTYEAICRRVSESDPDTEVTGVANDCRSFLLCMVKKDRKMVFIVVRDYPNGTRRKRKS